MAFAAAEQYSYGKRGRPRFKNAKRPLKSFSGKTNKTGIRYRSELGIVEWTGLVLPVKYPPKGKDLWLEQALESTTKFCRILWRNVKGKRRWYVQLAQTGLSPVKEANTTQAGCEVGLDVGPSSVAIERKLAAERKRSQGELMNSVIRLGNLVKTEKLSYKAWQKMYGRSVKVKAPGMFIAGLKHKAESAGGELRELNTWRLKMSQYDHISGEYSKKTLSERWHVLGGKGSESTTLVQRDMYSAFLALCVIENKHQSSQLHSRWPVVKQLLEQMGWCRNVQVASGEAMAFPTVKPSERLVC